MLTFYVFQPLVVTIIITSEMEVKSYVPSGNAEGRQSGKTTVVFTLQSNLFHLVNRGCVEKYHPFLSWLSGFFIFGFLFLLFTIIVPRMKKFIP
uniref:Uncharacterized protein n=1 Tax=Geobacillus sp. (strain Y4.1MC1) TaxID=581103 RepID=A0A7U3YGC3_GEOS0